MASTKEKEQSLKTTRKSSKKQEKGFSKEEYFEKLALSEEKLECHAGKIVAMAGAQLNHNRIVKNLIQHLSNCLEGKDCEVLPSDMLVYLPECNKYVFPDLTVTCEELEIEQHQKRGLSILKNPQIVIEVSSKSTEGYDLGDKMKCYLKLKSLKEYVIVSSESKLIITYEKEENGTITTQIYDEESEEVKIGSCELSLEQIYKRVGFEQQEN